MRGHPYRADRSERGWLRPSAALSWTFPAAVLAFNVFQGLYSGVRSALFMDVTTPAVAATQFTAYMAMSNLVTSYTAWWQGLSIVGWGYPVTLLIDSIVGMVGLFLLPMMKPVRAAEVAPTDAEGPRIAR